MGSNSSPLFSTYRSKGSPCGPCIASFSHIAQFSHTLSKAIYCVSSLHTPIGQCFLLAHRVQVAQHLCHFPSNPSSNLPLSHCSPCSHQLSIRHTTLLIHIAFSVNLKPLRLVHRYHCCWFLKLSAGLYINSLLKFLFLDEAHHS